MNESLQSDRERSAHWKAPERRDDAVGAPLFEHLPRAIPARADQVQKAKQRAEEIYIPYLSDDSINSADAPSLPGRRIEQQAETRKRLKEIETERASLRFWNIFKKADLDQEAAKLHAFLRSEERWAQTQTRAMQAKISLHRKINAVPDLQKNIDRAHASTKTLHAAFDRNRREDTDEAYETVNTIIKEQRRERERAENILLESFAQLGIDWSSALLNDYHAGKKLPRDKRTLEEQGTELETRLRNRIQQPEVQNNPVLMKWAHAAADALATIRVIEGRQMRERKPLPERPGALPIETWETYRPSTDEELLAGDEEDLAAK